MKRAIELTPRRLAPALVGFLFLGLAGVTPLIAADLPVGFIETVAFPNVIDALDFDWDPDGGMWIASKGGRVWVVRESTTLALQLPVETTGDAGIASLVIDPDYSQNHYVWIYYLTPPPWQNRLSRFTNTFDTLVNETIMLPIDSVSTGYNGGCFRFLPDGTIMVGMGFNGQASNVQNPFTLKGKLLRINPDGSAPPDNPYFDGIDGDPRVYARGLRQPWRCSLQPLTNELFLGDVGHSSWEDIHVAVAEGNYGFPLIEGPGQPGGTVVDEPFYSFQHQPGQNHAVIGGDFADAGDFPAEYEGDYFFADHNQQKIIRIQLDVLNNIESVEDFGTNMQWPVSLKFGPDGGLYYAAWQTDDIREIQFIGEAGAGGRPTCSSPRTKLPKGRSRYTGIPRAMRAIRTTPFSTEPFRLLTSRTRSCARPTAPRPRRSRRTRQALSIWWCRTTTSGKVRSVRTAKETSERRRAPSALRKRSRPATKRRLTKGSAKREGSYRPN